MSNVTRLLFTTALIACCRVANASGDLELSDSATIVCSEPATAGVSTAAIVLVEEFEKRTGLRFPVVERPAPGTVSIHLKLSAPGAGLRPEQYVLRAGDGARIEIEGADARGLLFGVGRFLRLMEWRAGTARIRADLDISSSPAYPIRGHQLGYRHTANSYDAWDVAQYDQYIRELALFGCNAVENIPFQDSDSPVMRVPREEMNRAISRICDRYDLDYWIWTPATFDLEDTALCAAALDEHEALYKSLPRLDAIFLPGGDPGDNPPRLVLPFLRDLKKRLEKHHPDAGMWVSLQGFDRDQVDEFFAYLDEYKPEWLAGVVAGPQSPPLPELRRRLPRSYRLRDYPDITHTVLCQYPVAWWDPAFALTLGREPVNPRAQDYAHIHHWTAGSTDGFITYSDGIHDDVNKIVWSVLGWAPEAPPRAILIEYARFFFRPDLAEEAADALLALETNWAGPLALNGSVDATHFLWQGLDARASELAENWRWRMHVFRAEYDYFTRHRLLYETDLEREANAALAAARQSGADAAMDQALAILARADTAPCRPDLRASLDAHGEALFRLIGYQTSVDRYHARNFERGAVLDFLDRPLNNRWWIEDEFAAIRRMPGEADKLARIETIRTWEKPAADSRYDDIGHIARMPRVERGAAFNVDPEGLKTPNVSFSTHIDEGKSRRRLSWLSHMDWPHALVYDGLDPEGAYRLRLTGRGDAFPRADGQPLKASKYSKGIGEFKEYPVPKELIADGNLVITFDPPDEKGVNWRYSSMLTEVWLIGGDE